MYTFFLSLWFPAHKDPYENIYCVVRGHKDIILHPPSDLPWMRYKDLKPCVYERNEETGKLKAKMIEGMDPVPWVTIDPTLPKQSQSADYAKYANPTRVRVEAGDALYLPSLWFHHLEQSHGCIAVNYWYDMEFDSKYVHYNLLNRLSSKIS